MIITKQANKLLLRPQSVMSWSALTWEKMWVVIIVKFIIVSWWLYDLHLDDDCGHDDYIDTWWWMVMIISDRKNRHNWISKYIRMKHWHKLYEIANMIWDTFAKYKLKWLVLYRTFTASARLRNATTRKSWRIVSQRCLLILILWSSHILIIIIITKIIIIMILLRLKQLLLNLLLSQRMEPRERCGISPFADNILT